MASTKVCVMRAANSAPARATGQNGKECCLQTQQDAGKRICMNTGDNPADGSKDDSNQGTKQDLKHEEKIWENGHKSTEMHTIIT